LFQFLFKMAIRQVKFIILITIPTLMVSEDIIKNLQKHAVEKGANSTKVIAVKDVFVEDWVRQKCEYGCNGYARHFTCPPYSPTPEETRSRMRGYNKALLVEFAEKEETEGRRTVNEVMFELEREAFLNGLHKAFSYGAGPCDICETCPAEEVENPSKYSKRECKNQEEARPAMEACGIDVFQTARKAGYEIHCVKENEPHKNFGLLLLE